MKDKLEEFKKMHEKNMSKMFERSLNLEKKEILFGLGLIESPVPSVARLLRDERKIDQSAVRESEKEFYHTARLLKERKAISDYAKIRLG